MKVIYRGHEIDCHRDECMAGYKLLNFAVFRISDQREIICDFTGGDDTVRDYIGYMKNRVDGYIIDPSEEFPDATEAELADHREKLKGL